MASRTLELTLISAQDLKDVNLFSKMEVYAVASFSGDHRSSQRTPADHHGGKNPAWNTTLRFPLPATGDLSRHTLHIILRSERALGDRDVGEVHIPLKELLDGPAAGKGPSTFVSYQVRKPSSGKTMGVLNISYKFVDTAPAAAGGGAAYPPPAAYPAPAKPAKYDEPAKAYPPEPVTAYPAPGYAKPEPVTAYPAGPSTGYAPPQAVPYGNPYPHQGYPGPAPAGYGYPPPPQGGYGYAPPPQAGYGYPPAGYAAPPMAAQRPKKNKLGMGLGAGLLGGAIGGLLLGEVVSDIGQADYDAGYDAGYDDGGGFDGGFGF